MPELKIIADENIPHVKQAFAALGEVTSLPGRSLQNADLQNCDCLLVRSVTRVNEQLLDHTPVKFVASATIGTDHVDLDYLQQRDIGFANAPGCNAESASEYMVNALFELSQKKGFDPFKLTAGIIGHGNVGSRLKQKLDSLGINTLVNDPPLEDAGDDRVNYVSLQSIIDECDFISLHVPFTREGAYPTYHMFDQALLDQLHKATILFNAARGPVIDNQALSELLKRRRDLTIFLDTWENEPAIDHILLQQVDLATPHIAGYSYEGKLRGTQMILHAACKHFAVEAEWNMQEFIPPKQSISVNVNTAEAFWPALFAQHYRVFDDHQRMLELAGFSLEQSATEFDLLRKHYPLRYEYSHFTVNSSKLSAEIINQLQALKFDCGD